MGANFVLQKPITTAGTLRCFNTAMSFMVREKRRYFRCPLEMPVKLVFKQGEELKATATNLSEGGMAIHFDGTLTKNAVAKVQFTVARHKLHRWSPKSKSPGPMVSAAPASGSKTFPTARASSSRNGS